MVTPRQHWAEVAQAHGERTSADWCVDLLSGVASAGDRNHPAFRALDDDRTIDGPSPHHYLRRILDGESPDYWIRVWGARGLLYIWDESASTAVIDGLADDHWRVREMCAKVCRLRGLAEAGDDLARLLTDDTPRVRLAAILALSVLGEAEQAQAVRRLLDDADRKVAAEADRALDVMSERLDRDLRSADRDL
jgi:hypothetical protein